MTARRYADAFERSREAIAPRTFLRGAEAGKSCFRPAWVPMKRAVLAAMLCILFALANVSSGSPPEGMSLGERGTSTTFMKRREIMAGDAFSPHGPALPARVAVENLERYDALWAANFLPLYNLPAWNLLRETHPNLLTLWYTSSVSTRTPNDFGCFPYAYIEREHPEWFVVREKGADPRDSDNRIRWSIHNMGATAATAATNHGRFYLDIANPEFQRFAAEWITARVSGEPDENTPTPHVKRAVTRYHGLAADNVDIGDRQCDILSRHFPNWQYAGRYDEWNAGFCKYLATMKAALNEKGFILVANHSLLYGTKADAAWWDCLLRSVDGMMSEVPMSFRGKPYTGESFELSLRRHERTLDSGLIDWWVIYPPADEAAGHPFFLYHYCSWLLVKQPGRSFFCSTRGDPDWLNPVVPWYKDEYEYAIGAPKSRRYQQGPCWVREYENATIVVNPTQTPQSIRVNETVVELPATGARILVKSDGPKGDR